MLQNVAPAERRHIFTFHKWRRERVGEALASVSRLRGASVRPHGAASTAVRSFTCMDEQLQTTRVLLQTHSHALISAQ